MRKLLFGTRRCRGAVIRYYMIREELENGAEAYGAQVEYLGETAAIPNLTVSRAGIETFLESLRRGRVTPVTAKYVAEDWLLDSSCNLETDFI